MTAYLRGGAEFDEHTIFAVADARGDVAYRRNVISTVRIAEFSDGEAGGGGGGGFAFRNPPHHVSFVEPTARDAAHETEAVLDHLARHDTTAPFVATRLIQRLTTSNPSPRYVRSVVRAFRNGSHAGFGSGRYGDLAATVAAVLLDREARAPVLDYDPTHGGAREPLLALLHFARAMELASRDARGRVLERVDGEIGQMAHRAPDVFNYYLPDYQPAGPVERAALVSPEAQLLVTPQIVGFLNGVLSLADYGLTHCAGGFGSNRAPPNMNCWRAIYVEVGDDPDDTAKALLGYAPAAGASAAEVVRELDVLLTAAAAAPRARARSSRTRTRASRPTTARLKAAQALMAATPEFHATNRNEAKPLPRNVTLDADAPGGEDYCGADAADNCTAAGAGGGGGEGPEKTAATRTRRRCITRRSCTSS